MHGDILTLRACFIKPGERGQLSQVDCKASKTSYINIINRVCPCISMYVHVPRHVDPDAWALDILITRISFIYEILWGPWPDLRAARQHRGYRGSGTNYNISQLLFLALNLSFDTLSHLDCYSLLQHGAEKFDTVWQSLTLAKKSRRRSWRPWASWATARPRSLHRRIAS